jgi:hypothetical protein
MTRRTVLRNSTHPLTCAGEGKLVAQAEAQCAHLYRACTLKLDLPVTLRHFRQNDAAQCLSPASLLFHQLGRVRVKAGLSLQAGVGVRRTKAARSVL